MWGATSLPRRLYHSQLRKELVPIYQFWVNKESFYKISHASYFKPRTFRTIGERSNHLAPMPHYWYFIVFSSFFYNQFPWAGVRGSCLVAPVPFSSIFSQCTCDGFVTHKCLLLFTDAMLWKPNSMLMFAAFAVLGYTISPQLAHLICTKYDTQGRRALTLDLFIQVSATCPS